MVEPRRVHWIEVKHVLRYIARSMEYGLDYVKGDGVTLIGYIYSDWVGAPQGIVSGWDQQLFHGSAENKSQWH
jgi:hypothetical protein